MMPFVSQAQRAKFYATPSLHRYIPEFEAATPEHAQLPQHVPSKVGRKKRHDRIAHLLSTVTR